jgi:Uma2 family endonuclease
MEAARRVEVVYDVPEEHDAWLLEEEDMPESPLHEGIVHVLVEVLRAWNQRSGGRAMVGSNIALRWNESKPRQGVDPDVYVVDPAPPTGRRVPSLCLWKRGHHPPRVAIEVVSESTADKDYLDGPDRYAASGTRELWVFDPLLAGPDLHGGPHRLQVWRRDPRARFRRVYAGDGPVRSTELRAWLVVVEGGLGLRIADDPEGALLWPTEAEAERAAHEAEQAAREAAEAARKTAEAKVAELEEEIARLQARPRAKKRR